MHTNEELLVALTQNNIPHYVNVHDLGFLISPHGIPYIPLPVPHDAYCLTNYLALRDVPNGENDAEAMENVTEWVNNILYASQGGWCTGVIRKTRDLETMTYPLLLGNVSMKRFKFDILSPEDDQLWTEKERDVSDRERHWNIAALVDPAYGGKGIAVAALRYILQKWYIPTIQTFPGQLVSGYFHGNFASRRMHEKLGFTDVAVSSKFAEDAEKMLPQWRTRKDELALVTCVWQGFDGEYKVDKKDTIFRNLPSSHE